MSRINIYENYSKKELLMSASKLSLDHNFTKKMAMLVNAFKNNHVHYQSIYSSQQSLKQLNKAILSNSGIVRKLGSGGFAFVYEGVDTLVYKISLSTEHEDAWLFYARTSKKKENTLFPVIHQLSVFGDDYCCKMEKLTKLRLKSSNEHVLKTISNSIIKKDFASSIHLINTIGLVSLDDYITWSIQLNKILKRNSHICFDFHKSNLMLRGKNLVIIDPLS